MLILTGPPGIGKSRLALALASQKKGFEFVWWLRAGDDAQLRASIDRLADSAGLVSAGALTDTLHALVRSMPQPGLIVFDDAKALSQVKALVDVSGASSVIVTTSTGATEGYLVGGLAVEESVLLFVSGRAGVSRADAQTLIEKTDGRPLLLLHACHFIGGSGSSVADYLELLERPSSIFSEWPYEPPDYAKAQERIIPLSLVQLAESSPGWSDLSAILTALAPSPIPVDLLRALDEDSDKFLQAAQESFVVMRDAESQTVEMPTLIRNALIELGAARRESEVRPRIWSALEQIADRELTPAKRGYLIEHVSYLGLDKRSAGAAATLAKRSQPGPQRVAMWTHAYESTIADAPDRHNRVRVGLADRAGWALFSLGQYPQAERLVGRELHLANEAGCIECRGPLLHLLGHVMEVGINPESEDLRAFRAAAVAMRIAGKQDESLQRTLVDIVFACGRSINDERAEKNPSDDKIEALIREGDACLEEARSLKDELSPLGTSGLSVSDLQRLTEAERRWRAVRASVHGVQGGDGADDEPEPLFSGSNLSPGAVFMNLINTFHLKGEQVEEELRAMVHSLSRIPDADLGEKADAGEVEEAGVDLVDQCRRLRKALLKRFGEDSHILVLADFVEMVEAHIAGGDSRAASACERFSERVITADPTLLAPYLIRGLAFDLQLKEGDQYSQDAYRILVSQVRWFPSVPRVEAFVWLLSESLSKSEAIPLRKTVHSSIRAVSRLGSSGSSVAAYLTHMYAHRENLDRRESLRFHRISVRIYQEIAVTGSSWGLALYCYAHSLLEMRMPCAAERRFREARDILTMVDGGSKAVAHIDEHFASETAPYLPRETDEADART